MYETYSTISGRVITDPRLSQTPAHGDVVSLRVACHSRKQDRTTGEWSDGATLYLTVVCWRRLATVVAQTVRRGSLLIAHGQLRTNEYTGGDGNKRSDLEMTAVSLGLDLAHPQPGAPLGIDLGAAESGSVTQITPEAVAG
ncbi:MAG: single-stranded DNA-binding protein [Gordonia sp. (in: high G+C Gram-positive bacteria)]|uniref:single-stranded DNA-binding protein n=1 Tax=Gordonia sp. (in: high G+C Gram-positive bacteria) TaxID=84139 RepID=UPI003BB60286